MVTPAAAIRKAKKSLDEQSSSLSKIKLLKFYKQMMLLRRFEERAGQLYGMGLIGGFCHLYIGQEAVVVGLQDCIDSSSKGGDQVVTTYRDHAHMLACDTPPEIIYAELMGRESGCSKGKGGSMHMFDLENHFYGGHGIVGANVPIGTGLAFSNKYRGTDNVCLTYFGDGAANQGQVYESFNMASLWDIPVIYVIENNEYAMGTSVQRSSSVTELYKRGEAFGIPGIQVDGMDVMAVHKAGQEAVAHARSGNGPIILEMKTYRYRGHSMSDPAKYRTKEEVKNIKESRDPILLLKTHLLEEEYAKEADLKKIEDEIKNKLETAVEKAKSAPAPHAGELYTDIYLEGK